MAQRWAYRYIAICYVGLMLAQRLHACVTTLGQHRPNMLGQQRPTLHLDIAPTLSSQRWANKAGYIGPTLCQHTYAIWEITETYITKEHKDCMMNRELTIKAIIYTF